MIVERLEQIRYTPRMRNRATEGLHQVHYLMTVEQAAEDKGVSKSTVYNAIAAGTLHPQAVGDIHVLFRAEVEQWKPKRRRKRKNRGEEEAP